MIVGLMEIGKMKRFPIIEDPKRTPHPHSISWDLAEQAYTVYSSQYGKSQSLERIAERGGFYPSEMDEFVPGWEGKEDDMEALKHLCRFLAKQQEKQKESIGKAVMLLHKGEVDEARKQLAQRTPIIQGFQNQLYLRRIGEQNIDTPQCLKAIELLLK